MDSKRIAIVIIFFNPNKEDIEWVNDLSEDFNVFVADNTVYENNSIFGCKFSYFPMNENVGIGKAQNVALNYALKKPIEYILFLDQDSRMVKSDVLKLVGLYETISIKDPQIAAIGPNPVNESKGKPYKSNLTGNTDKLVPVGALINSGTLTHRSVIENVGLMDQTLFIDYVDFEWCWRARNKKLNIYLTRDIELKHHVGKLSYSFMGISFVVSASIRYYYRLRNYIWLSHRKYVPLKWKIKTAVHLVIELLMVVLHPAYKGERSRILKNIRKGVIDGFKGYENFRIS